jgi:hypothetical protein
MIGLATLPACYLAEAFIDSPKWTEPVLKLALVLAVALILQIVFIGLFFMVYQKMEKAAEKQATYTKLILVSRHLENEFSDAALTIGMVVATKTKPSRQSFEGFRVLVMGTKRQLEGVTATAPEHQRMMNSIHSYLDSQLNLLDKSYQALNDGNFTQASISSQQMYQRSREMADKYEAQVNKDGSIDLSYALSHRYESTMLVFGGAIGALIMAGVQFFLIRRIMNEY